MLEKKIFIELEHHDLVDINAGSGWDFLAAIGYTVGYVIAVAGMVVAEAGRQELEDVWTEAFVDN